MATNQDLISHIGNVVVHGYNYQTEKDPQKKQEHLEKFHQSLGTAIGQLATIITSKVTSKGQSPQPITKKNTYFQPTYQRLNAYPLKNRDCVNYHRYPISPDDPNLYNYCNYHNLRFD